MMFLTNFVSAAGPIETRTTVVRIMISLMTVSGMALWGISTTMSFSANREWLIWLANQDNQQWYQTALTDSNSGTAVDKIDEVADESTRASVENTFPSGGSSQKTSHMLPPAPGTLYAPGAGNVSAAKEEALTKATRPSHEPKPGDTTRTLDLNTATPEQLLGLPGIEHRLVESIVSARSRLGGFSDPAQLVTHAGVQPHVFAKIQHRLVAGNSHLPSTTPPVTEPHAGRKLEF